VACLHRPEDRRLGDHRHEGQVVQEQHTTGSFG
jgi:hypothetical protein